ncbi:unnamed protein product [Prorocentrum cordatum]|uniref:Polynucleotide adenylyltransferase n=1 Tax=Prorocentrum cordatum TaxID=2364126 RepID=A0ABN9QXY1_9DINO|nr:unnamed protein product [Polarella glacialis]
MTVIPVAAAREVGGVGLQEWPSAWRATVDKAAQQEPADASATTTDSEQHEEPDFAALRGHLELVLARAVPTVPEVQHLWACLSELARSLAPLGRVWRLSPFGSVRNLLLTRGSDVDATIYRSDGQDEGDSAAAVRVLQGSVLPLLSQSSRFEVVRLVPGARIPVLSLRFDGAVDVDLSCHNTEPLRNSQLLRAYAQVSPLVRGLALLVKLWSKAAGVCGAQSRNLTSYALALMAIYFLQVHPDFGLPLLSTQLFDGFGHLPPAPRWECRAPLPGALRQFFAFYAREFEWGREVVSVRLGRRCRAGGPEFTLLPNAADHRLHVEDPFLTGRNLNCVLGLEQEAQLQAALRAAEAALRGGGLPLGLGGVAVSAGGGLAGCGW